MPIGKDSITKRVAKATTEEKIAPELVATVAAAPAEKKAPAKKASASTAKKTASSTAKKTATSKKPAAPKAEEVKETADPVAEAPVVETAVLANVSPETVAAVIGHKEDEKYEKVQIGQKMPDCLL